MFVVTIIWGINSIAVKDALGAFLPLQFNVIRLGLAAVLLLLVMKVSGKWEVPSRKDWPMVVVAGFLGNTLYQFMFIKGIALSSATNTSFVLATMPAMTSVLSHFMGREKMTPRMWGGVLLTMVGVAGIVLGGSGGLASLTSGALAGDLTTLSGTLGWCLCTIFASDLTRRMSPTAFTAWTMVSGATLLAPLSIREMAAAPWRRVSVLNWSELVFSASLALVFSYILWNKGVKESGPASTAVFTNLTPMWTGFFGWLLLHESWTPLKLVGAAVILVGVSLVRFAAPLASVQTRAAGEQ
jgi:drug/metabolite transporter (DMT)-like permease